MPNPSILTNIAIIGCGAITEQQYVPALLSLKEVEVIAIFDPSSARANLVKDKFPGARSTDSIASLAGMGVSAVIVASPAAYHAAQSIEAMEAGMHVLCEKPMAGTVEEAERMIATSQQTGKLLAVGLFRRFFPTTLVVKEMIQNQPLGKLKRYRIAEGGPFGWPAVSPTFFQKQHSHGGVLHDHGAHVLDLVLHWLGEPISFSYTDDSAGGLETNCLLTMKHADGCSGEIRLSREWATANRNHFEFERGWIGWDTGQSNSLEMGLHGSQMVYSCQLNSAGASWGLPTSGVPLNSYAQSFTEQIANFCRAIRGEETLLVPGSEGIRSMRLIEACYQSRQEMSAK